jgi:hypothetical protein
VPWHRRTLPERAVVEGMEVLVVLVVLVVEGAAGRWVVTCNHHVVTLLRCHSSSIPIFDKIAPTRFAVLPCVGNDHHSRPKPPEPHHVNPEERPEWAHDESWSGPPEEYVGISSLACDCRFADMPRIGQPSGDLPSRRRTTTILCQPLPGPSCQPQMPPWGDPR